MRRPNHKVRAERIGNICMSTHAKVRSQQRGIPSHIVNLLINYGRGFHDRRGGIRRMFTRESLLEIQDEYGANFIRENHEHWRSYLVEGVSDGLVITTGKLYI